MHVYILMMLSSLVAGAQGAVQEIVKTYSRGEGPTELNGGLGNLQNEKQYDRQGRLIREIQYGQKGFMANETIFAYGQGIKPISITRINYPKGFWPGMVSLQSLSANHPDRKPDTTVTQNSYQDTLLLRSDYFRNGKLSSWATYRYDEAGFEIETASFEASNGRRSLCRKTTRDEAHRPIQVEVLRTDGSLESSESFSYDQHGQLIKKDYREPERGYHAQSIFAYNAAGLKTQEKTEIVAPDDMKTSYGKWYAYDHKGQLIVEAGLDALGQTKSKLVYSYNAQGQKVKTESEGYSHHFRYNKQGDLVSGKMEDYRSEMQAKKRFVYQNGLLQKTEHYNRQELTGYTRYYYDAQGQLIREEPNPVEGREALDWITRYEYNTQGQLICKRHKQPGNLLFGTISINPQHTGKADPYAHYTEQITYYSYDAQGRALAVYTHGGEMNRIIRLDGGQYGIYEESRDPFGMPSQSIQLIDRLDTVKVESRGTGKIITLKLDYALPVNPQGIVPVTEAHQGLIREESWNAKGEMIRLKETTHDGQLLFLASETENKMLSQLYRYEASAAHQFHYGRYGFSWHTSTHYDANGLVRFETNAAKDSITYRYEQGQVSSMVKKFGSGFYNMTCYSYDKNGMKTSERVFREDGMEDYRLEFENKGKQVLEERHVYVRPNLETLYEIRYFNP